MNQTIIVEDASGAANVLINSMFILSMMVSAILFIFCCLVVIYLLFILHKTKQELIETQLATQNTVMELQHKIIELERSKLHNSEENWSTDTNDAVTPRSQNSSVVENDDINDTTTDIIMTSEHNTQPLIDNYTYTHEFNDQSTYYTDNNSVYIKHGSTTTDLEIIYDSDNFGDECKHSHGSVDRKETQSLAISNPNAGGILSFVQPIPVTRQGKYIFSINRLMNTECQHDACARQIVTNTNTHTAAMNVVDTYMYTNENSILDESRINVQSDNSYNYNCNEKCDEIHVPAKITLFDNENEDIDEVGDEQKDKHAMASENDDDDENQNDDAFDEQKRSGQIDLPTNINMDSFNYNDEQVDTVECAKGSDISSESDSVDDMSSSDESIVFAGITTIGTVLRRLMLNVHSCITCVECFTSLRRFCDEGYSSVSKTSNRMNFIHYKNGKGLKIIIKTIRKHIAVANVVQNGFQLLNTLSKPEMKNTYADSRFGVIEGNYIDESASMDKLLEAGLLNLIIDATQLHCGNEDVVINGLTALKQLSLHLSMKKENLGELFMADNRMIRDIYQHTQKYIHHHSRANIVATACAILANIIILDSYETLKMVHYEKLIIVLRDMSLRFSDREIVQQECVRCWSNVILAHKNGTMNINMNMNTNHNHNVVRYYISAYNEYNYDNYKGDMTNEMEKCMIPAQITFIITQFYEKQSRKAMILIENCLHLITLLCINSSHKNINVHLQLVTNNIGKLLELILKSYHNSYETLISPMSHPDKQQSIVNNVCCVLRNLVINSHIVDKLFDKDKDKEGIAFQLSKICQLHDTKLQRIGLNVDPTESDIILCMNEPFTQEVLKTLYYLRDCEWNHMFRYLWIGFYKNDQQCVISWLPKDLVRYIMRFLGNTQIRAACALYSGAVDEKFAIN